MLAWPEECLLTKQKPHLLLAQKQEVTLLLSNPLATALLRKDRAIDRLPAWLNVSMRDA